MNSVGLPEVLLITFIIIAGFVIILLLPYWRIFKKAGFHPALSLFMVLPLVNIVMLYVLAFSDWPALRKSSMPDGTLLR